MPAMTPVAKTDRVWRKVKNDTDVHTVKLVTVASRLLTSTCQKGAGRSRNLDGGLGAPSLEDPPAMPSATHRSLAPECARGIEVSPVSEVRLTRSLYSQSGSSEIWVGEASGARIFVACSCRGCGSGG